MFALFMCFKVGIEELLHCTGRLRIMFKDVKVTNMFSDGLFLLPHERTKIEKLHFPKLQPAS